MARSKLKTVAIAGAVIFAIWKWGLPFIQKKFGKKVEPPVSTPPTAQN